MCQQLPGTFASGIKTKHLIGRRLCRGGSSEDARGSRFPLFAFSAAPSLWVSCLLAPTGERTQLTGT